MKYFDEVLASFFLIKNGLSNDLKFETKVCQIFLIQKCDSLI